MEELTDFIEANPDPRELKRALAVQMVMQNYTHSQIREILRVSVGFVNKWKHIFSEQGIRGLRLKHQGSRGYLINLANKNIASRQPRSAIPTDTLNTRLAIFLKAALIIARNGKR